MPYFVHVTERDQAYLDALPVSDAAKETVADFIEKEIADVTDAYRNDPRHRTEDPRNFRIDLVLVDPPGDWKVHRIAFFVNDQHVESGVLTITRVECQPE